MGVAGLGTPNRGSFDAAMLVRDTYPFLQKLAAFDFANSAEELAREAFIDFPSVCELLPAPGSVTGLSLLDPASWPRSGFQPNAALLQRAVALQDALAKPDGERFFLIAGVNQSTVTGIRLEGDEFVYDSTAEGDGTVPLSLCKLDDTRTYCVGEEHGALPNSDSVDAAVCEILRNGAATCLPDQPPALRGSLRRSTSDSECRELERQMKHTTRGCRISTREARDLLSEVGSRGAPRRRDDLAQRGLRLAVQACRRGTPASAPPRRRPGVRKHHRVLGIGHDARDLPGHRAEGRCGSDRPAPEQCHHRGDQPQDVQRPGRRNVRAAGRSMRPQDGLRGVRRSRIVRELVARGAESHRRERHRHDDPVLRDPSDRWQFGW